MKNYIQPGKTLTVTAPAGGCTSGKAYKVGGIIGVASTTVAEGESVELQVEGVFSLDKVSAQAWTEGAPIYFNASTGLVTNASAAGLFLVGVATAVAANPSSVGNVRLNGTLGIAAQAA